MSGLRIGTMVGGLLLAILTFLMSWWGSAVGELSNDRDIQEATANGLWASFAVGLGATLVLAWPLVSAILFIFGAILGFVAASYGWEDQYFYATLMLGLSVLAFVGWRGKLREGKERAWEYERQIARDSQLTQLLQNANAGPKGLATDTRSAYSGRQDRLVCSICGASNPESGRFCAECGSPLGVPKQVSSTPLLCPQCGESNAVGTRFCIGCGSRFSRSQITDMASTIRGGGSNSGP